MSDIPGAIGTAIEGAAIARAVEPSRGEKPGEIKLDHGHFAESTCLNCGTPLAGHYCAECGQAAHLHRTFGAFLHDVAHGVLHLDGKTWRTLPKLALNPGRLTRDYIDGHRARYVSPMALFLFSVFLMFAVFQVIGIGPPTDLGAPVQIDMGNDEARREAQLEGLQAARDALPGDSPLAPNLDRQIAVLERQMAGSEPATPAAAEAGDKETLAQSADGRVKFTAEKTKTGWVALDHGIDKWRDNPSLMAYKLQSNSYKFSWLLIPLSLPFVALLFLWRRRFGLYDHAVFVTYSIAFMTLWFLVLAIAGAAGISSTVLFTLGTTIPIAHLYRQVRGGYELSRFSAAWRTVALLGLIVIVAVLFAISLIMLGLLG